MADIFLEKDNLLVTFIWENSKMKNKVDLENIFGRMEMSMKVIGKMALEMDLVK